MPRNRQHYEFDNIPETWDDISLNEFIEYKKLYDEYDNNVPITKLLAFVTKKDEAYLKDAPALIIQKLVAKLQFLREPLPSLSSNMITIGDKTYYINTEEHMKFQEFVDSQTIMQNNPQDFPTLLGVICRQDGEKYDDDFIAKVLPSRIRMFGKQPMTKIQPLLNFFLDLSVISQTITPQYLETLVSQTNHMLNDCESLIKNGDGKKLSTWWQMRKLKTLKKQLNNIAQQSFNI